MRKPEIFCKHFLCNSIRLTAFKVLTFSVVFFADFTCSRNVNTSANVSLKQLTQLNGKKVGTLYDNCCIDTSQLFHQENIIKRECSIITNGNFFIHKCHYLKDQYDFTVSDAVNNFAKENNLEIRGHTLIWHEHLTDWLEKSAEISPEEVGAELKMHIQTVVAHNKRLVKYWDVVNEPLENDGSSRESFYKKTIGTFYIDSALIWAHEADSSAQLFINEYGIELGGPKCDSLYALVRGILDRKVPLHGIGFQCHFNGMQAFNAGEFRKSVRKFTSLGLKVHFTEIDVRLPDSGVPLFSLYQNIIYKDIAEIFMTEKGCDAFVVWGVSDAHSWISRFFKGWGNACLYDKNYLPKNTYFTISRSLQKLSSTK